MSALADSRDENLPDSGASESPHHVASPVPCVEIPDNADALGIGRPHGKRGALDTFHLAWVRPKNLVGFQVLPLAKEVKIQFPEGRGKSIRVTDVPGRTIGQRDVDHVVPRSRGHLLQAISLEQAIGMYLGQRKFLSVDETECNTCCPWIKNPGNRPARLLLAHAKDPMRIAMPAFQKRIKVLGGQKHGGGEASSGGGLEALVHDVTMSPNR